MLVKLAKVSCLITDYTYGYYIVVPIVWVLLDTSVGELLCNFSDIGYKFLEGFVIIFMLSLPADLLPIGVNDKVQYIDTRSHVVFSDLYSDFIDFH